MCIKIQEFVLLLYYLSTATLFDAKMLAIENGNKCVYGCHLQGSRNK